MIRKCIVNSSGNIVKGEATYTVMESSSLKFDPNNQVNIKLLADYVKFQRLLPCPSYEELRSMFT